MFSDSGVMKTLQENPMFQELFSNPELTRDIIMSSVRQAKDFLQVMHPALSFKYVSK